MYSKLLQSCLTPCDAMDCSLPGSPVYGDSPGKKTGMGCHFLLQGVFSGIEPTSLTSPALAGRVFTTSVIQESLLEPSTLKCSICIRFYVSRSCLGIVCRVPEKVSFSK